MDLKKQYAFGVLCLFSTQASFTTFAGNSYKQLQRSIFTPKYVLLAQEWVDQLVVSNVFFDFEY